MVGFLVHGNNRKASHHTYFYRNDRIGCRASIGLSEDTSHISIVIIIIVIIIIIITVVVLACFGQHSSLPCHPCLTSTSIN